MGFKAKLKSRKEGMYLKSYAVEGKSFKVYSVIKVFKNNPKPLNPKAYTLNPINPKA